MEENKDLITPAEYFERVKELKVKTDDESLVKFYNSALTLLKKYDTTGQTRMVDKVLFVIDTITKERELVKKGINIFIYKEDIEEYVNKVEDKVVKIIELKNYPREIPDELVDVIKDTEHIFDDFYILFTDYTGEVEKQVEEVRKEKDPILFGIFKNGNNLYNRFYYLGDWIDEYCDLTLEKIIEEEGERIAKTISTPITTDELLLELERIKEERSNTKNDNIHYTYTISNNVVTSKNIDSYNDSEYNSDRIEEVTDRKFFSKVKTFLTKRGKK